MTYKIFSCKSIILLHNLKCYKKTFLLKLLLMNIFKMILKIILIDFNFSKQIQLSRKAIHIEQLRKENLSSNNN